MKCPYCANLDSKVIDSRPLDEGVSIRRRRECLSCNKRFTTYETLEKAPLVVIKKDGARQPFDKSKLLRSMVKSCEKTRVSVTVLTQLADEIEQNLQNKMVQEIDSAEIGKQVMDKLKSVDEAAFVRFASVYHQFKDIDTFKKEIVGLLQESDQ